MQGNGNITPIRRTRPVQERTQEQLKRRRKDKGWERTDNATVFGYVPVSIVIAWIEKHGGIDFEKTLAGK